MEMAVPETTTMIVGAGVKVRVKEGLAVPTGATLGVCVGVKNIWANACWVRARSIGVEVAVCLGAITMSSRLSTLSPASISGTPNARAHVPTTANKITESWALLERMVKTLCQIFQT
jgi:hypothetical protein